MFLCFRLFRQIAALSGLMAMLFQPAAAQKTQLSNGQLKVYKQVDQMPELPSGGGTKTILQAIQQRLVYPPAALNAQVEGRVFASFVVSTTGRVGQISILKGLVADCDLAVVQAIKQLPRFKPGRLKGRAVPVQFTLPVTFLIAD